MNFAVIDLGSNTFHILIVRPQSSKKHKVIFRQRDFTALSEDGVDHIQKHRFLGGLETLRQYKNILQLHQPLILKVIGTEVLRRAENSASFLAQAHLILDHEIEIIDGIQEAFYIFYGIMLFKSLHRGRYLIMDIGGGSTEFILVINGRKIWSQSYPLGVSVLHQQFHTSEPIGGQAIEKMYKYCSTVLSELQLKLSEHPIYGLVGASGSFEVLQTMSGLNIKNHQLTKITVTDFDPIYNTLIYKNEVERASVKGLPKERVKLIVVAMVLKKIILEMSKPKAIIVCPYALKEGVLRVLQENVQK